MAGVPATTSSPAATRPLRRDPGSSLSVLCMTAGPGPRVAALLGSLRAAADEILVALDDRAHASVHADIATVADRIIVYPYAEPVDRPLPWLFGQCRCDWVLALDDDEIPSLALIAALPDLLADAAVVHYSLPRRWLFPDTSTYLDDAPWRPDYALRLVRPDPRLVRFSAAFHRPIVAAGPGRFLEQPLWHADTSVRTYTERLEKARRYERTRPGIRVGARALNFAFYVPEARDDVKLAAVPPAERAHIDAILDAPAPPGAARAAVSAATREEIDARWPATDPAAQSGRLELLEAPAVLFAGEQRTIDVRVHNTGSAAWPWGWETEPAIRLGSRWAARDGFDIPGLQVWSALPAPLEPGHAQIVPAHVRAPQAPGRYRIDIDLVHEHVRWLGATVSTEVLVQPRRRIAVVGDDDDVAAVARVLEEIPELELVALRRTPLLSPSGYPQAPDPRSYLFDGAPASRLAFAATLAWRSLRLLVGPPPAKAADFLSVLSGCDVLVVGSLDGPPQRRERWALALTARAARSHGVQVVRGADPSTLLALLKPAR